MPASPGSENDGRPVVVVSAARLAPEAVTMLEQAGYAVVCTSGYPSEAELIAAIRQHRPVALLHRQGLINAAVLQAGAPELRIVARHGAGIDGIDLAAARASGVTLTRAAGANARSVAEHTMALMLGMVKDLPSITAGMREGLWEKTSRMTRDIDGMVLGLIGYGAIGSKVARYATAFGMTVLAYDPYLTGGGLPGGDLPGGDLPGPGERIATLPELLRRAEILSVHCPLEAETRGMIGAAQLALLPRGAILVTTARGGIVEEAALLAALESGQVSWAGVDVFAREPLDADNPLRTHPRVVPTPHLAANTPRGALGMACGAADSIIAMLDGRLPALEGAVVLPGGLAALSPAG